MGFLRRGGDEPGGERFLMRGKLLAIGDDFWIENDRGERAYKVNGKAFRLRQTFVPEDASGGEVARIQERKLSIRDKIAIERDGDTSRGSQRNGFACGSPTASTSRQVRTPPSYWRSPSRSTR
jgi:LURP-one-related